MRVANPDRISMQVAENPSFHFQTNNPESKFPILILGEASLKNIQAVITGNGLDPRTETEEAASNFADKLG